LVDFVRDLDPRAGDEVRRVARAQRIEVVPRPLPRTTGRGASIPKREDDRVVREAGLDVEGSTDRATIDRHDTDEGQLLALLEVGLLNAGDLERGTVRVYAELPSETRADLDGVVPGDFGDRIRDFLQPAVVGEASIVDAAVGDEANLEVVL